MMNPVFAALLLTTTFIMAEEKKVVRWARVTDAYGSDIALVAEKPMTRSYPFTSVQYRIEDGKTDFIVALFRSLEYTMKENAK